MDFLTLVRFAAALAAVIGLIFLAAALLKRFGMAGRVGPMGQRRLAIVEALPLDGRRRLVLVRRDGTEHLLLVGAEGSTVIESGIGPAGSGPAREPAKESVS